MTSSGDCARRRTLRSVIAMLLVVAGVSCRDTATAPGLTGIAPIEGLTAIAVGPTSVRLAWVRAEAATLGYRVERRANYRGDFVDIGMLVPARGPGDSATFVDDGLEPETTYGYRVVGVSQIGGRTEYSLVRGATTPPLPGMFLRVVTEASGVPLPPAFQAILTDSTGVVAARGVIATPNDARLFSPLADGTYRVALADLPVGCRVAGDSIRPLSVRSDRGARTVDSVQVFVSCRDGTRGDLVVRVSGAGTNRDSVVQVTVTGTASGSNVPDAERNYSASRSLSIGSDGEGVSTFSALRAGTYAVQLSGLAPNCTATDTVFAGRSVTPQGVDSVRFAYNCRQLRPPPPPISEKPYRIRLRFEPTSARPGDTVALRMQWDPSGASPALPLEGIDMNFRYDQTGLSFVQYRRGDLGFATANGRTAGLVLLAIASDAGPVAGIQDMGTVRFVVLPGPEGELDTQTQVRTLISENLAGTSIDTARAYVEEGIVQRLAAVSPPGGGTNPPPGGGGTTPPPGGGGGTNPPSLVAEANGPYSGTAGSPVAFSSAGSSSGSGVSFRWQFPGGLESTSANPQFTFATAGTYVVRLDVTSGGVTARDSATVSIAAAPSPPPGGGSPPPSSGQPSVYYTFVPNPSGTVTMTVFLNFSVDVPQTNGPEVLAEWSLSEIRFDPTVLEFIPGTIRLGQYHNSNASLVQGQAASGVLSITDVRTDPNRPNRTGLITLARIDFRPVGASGRSMSTTTRLGPIIGAGEVGFFVYNGLIGVQEGTYTIP